MEDIRLRAGKRSVSAVAIYAVLISVCYILPVIKYSVPYLLLGSALLITYVLALLGQKVDQTVVLPSVICAFVLMLMTSLITYPGNLTEGINEFIRALRMVAPGILFLMLCRSSRPNKREMTVVFLVIAGLMIYICYNTLIALDEDSMIARILAGGTGLDEEFKRLRFKNIGGFEVSYSAGFLCLFFWFIALEKNCARLLRMVSLGVCAYLAYFIIRTQYLILVMIVMCGLAMILILSRRSGSGKIVILALCLILIPMLPQLVEMIGGADEESTGLLLEKLEDIEATGDGGVEVLGSRPKVYWEAFVNFLKSPVWGQSVIENGFFIQGMERNHSTLLGCLQNTGLIGAVCFYYPLVRLMKLCYRRVCGLSEHAGVFWKCICVLFVVLSILNPIQYCFEISFVIFLCVPCGMIVLLTDRKRKE